MKLLEFVEIFSFIWRVLKGKLKKSWLFQYDITDVIQIHEVETKVGQKGSTAQQKNIKHQDPYFSDQNNSVILPRKFKATTHPVLKFFTLEPDKSRRSLNSFDSRLLFDDMF